MQNAIDKPTKLALTFKAWKQRLFENKWCSNTCRQTTWYSKGFILCKHDFYCILLTSLVNIHLVYYVCLIICPPGGQCAQQKAAHCQICFLLWKKTWPKNGLVFLNRLLAFPFIPVKKDELQYTFLEVGEWFQNKLNSQVEAPLYCF